MSNRIVNAVMKVLSCAAILTFSARDVSVPAQQANTELKVQVPLVVEDLVVLDHDGQPVHGLRASNLTVTEGGKPVTLRNFEEHSAQPAVTVPQAPDLGPNVFTNMAPTPTSDSLNVLLFDALNTPMTDQAEMRQQMLEYLKTLPPGIPIAVFGLNTQLYMLQGFSTDPKVLAAAIDASKNLLRASPRLDHPASDERAPTMSDFVAQFTGNNNPAKALMLEHLRQFELENQIAEASQRVQYTVLALSQMARYLSGLPARKNLIWFSGSFALNFIPDSTQAHPFLAVADFQDEVRKATDLLARSQVAVYPVDGRQLFSNPAFSGTERNALMFGARSGGPQIGPGVAHHDDESKRPGSVQVERDFTLKTNAEHATMNLIADDTGGKAFFDTNDLKSAIEKAVDDGSNYYTFAYTPPNEKYDGTYRRIEVKVDRPDLHLSYRQSYLADDPEQVWRGKKVLPQSTMQAAMMFGSPAATQIPIMVQVTPDDVPVDKPSQGTKPNTKLMKPPFRRYEVIYVTDIHNALFAATPDGVRHAKLEFAAVVYDADGQLVDTAGNQMNLDFPPDRYAQILERGLRASLSIEAPMKGDYFLRIGFYDAASDRVGAVEVPVSSLKSQQAMTRSAAENSAPK